MLIPDIKVPITFIFPKKEKIKKFIPKELDTGVDLFVKLKGRRKKIESNISMNDMLDIGSFIADNTISQQFSFKPTNKQPVSDFSSKNDSNMDKKMKELDERYRKQIKSKKKLKDQEEKTFWERKATTVCNYTVLFLFIFSIVCFAIYVVLIQSNR